MRKGARYTTEEKLLLDSNTLVYAYDKTSTKHNIAVETIENAILSGMAVVSVQNLAEFSRVVTEKLPQKLGYEQTRNIALELAEAFDVIYYDEHIIADALNLCEMHKLHFFDSLLVATMEKEKIKTIVTDNEKDFKKIEWLNVVNPFK